MRGLSDFWRGGVHSPLDEYATHLDIAARNSPEASTVEVERRAAATFETWQRCRIPPGA